MLKQSTPFAWPRGKRAALSLTFDDARPSQLDRGLPILDRHGVKATFYAGLRGVKARPDAWRAAKENGHEIGNHTLSHPCSGNFSFARANALEDYTLERMERDLTGANAALEEVLGVTPQTFAYPCGQKFVGRGEQLQSYVPLVAKYFRAGRGFRDEAPNDPTYCDPAQLFGMDADGAPFEVLKAYCDKALAEGGWLVLCGHDVGGEGSQAVQPEVLEMLCRFAQDEDNGLWLDTVANVAGHVHRSRNK